ncbi:uncharacterized protein LOC9651996 isoform X2 [Selaginella moellendorffii]|uniref:uncharacterized protein LOC9651996 isoform X2 n=1 Tax=Selaginella moellendorffii TaxID=88036 RepID=UPI000D1CAF71|nr:uncharacterized protein LOC9651996 isoform X2 [Selaginella moellendorffii]|eukprot:XP_024517532.1 uncharacterized protein LOC9651996 isoform X2 [Selaginella moellendorffii]
MLQGRESLIRVVGKQQRSVSLQDAPPAQILACQVGRKTRSRCLPDTLQRLHHWTCAWISFYPVRSSLIESPLQAICDGGARQLVVEALWEVNWENEDLHTITGLSVIHMLLAENQGGQNWSKPRVREIACPSNRWPGFLFSRMPGTLCMSSSASSSPPDLA